tara:strand:+ start:242 stop:364 length:123 start_codon:yes stop_codon:yes gene_type:complete
MINIRDFSGLPLNIGRKIAIIAKICGINHPTDKKKEPGFA